MGWIKRRRESDDALAQSRRLLLEAEQPDVTPDRVRVLIDLSDAWIRHGAAACPPPR